jgi:hypothetical protein
MSGGVCEPRHENGSTEQRATVFNNFFFFFFVKLGDSATTTHGKLQQAFGDDAMSKHNPFAGTKCFLKAEPLLKMSSAADDHQQHSTNTRTCSIRSKFDGQQDC